MCLLSYFPPGVQPNQFHLECGASCNPHGYGYAIVIPGEDEILIGKGMNSATVIDEFMRMREEYPDGPALFHSRYTTHGEQTVDNCHPFIVNGDKRTVLAHNGILPQTSPLGLECHPAGSFVTTIEPIKVWRTTVNEDGTKTFSFEVTGSKEVRRWVETDDRSDTRILAEDVFATEFRRMDRNKTRRKLETWLGNGNKLVVLTTDPFYQQRAYIFNERLGDWTGGGVWHSNDGYLYAPAYRSKDVGAWWDREDGWYTDSTKLSKQPILGSASSREGFTGSEDDPAVWPVTLGGTRPLDEDNGEVKVDLTDCELCGQNTVISDAGFCYQCMSCQLCLDYLADCACFFKPRPHLMSFRDLKNVCKWGTEFAVLQAYHRYSESCLAFDRLDDDYGTDDYKARKDAADAELMREASSRLERRAITANAAMDADAVVTVLGSEATV